MTFEEQLELDVKDIFLKENSQIAILKSGAILKEVRIHLFEESLDKMGTQYYHAWGSYSDMSSVKTQDILIINDVEYGIVDYSPDEFNTGMNIFLNKV